MSTPIERGRYWVFTEKQLAKALDAYMERVDVPENGIASDDDIEAHIEGFLNSPECIEQGMRRGGEDESQ